MLKKMFAMGEPVFSGKSKKYFLFIVIIAVTCVLFSSVSRAESLKIGFVTDWEYGAKKEFDHKLPKKAEKYLNAAVNHFNNVFQPDLVIGGGDYILGRGINKKKAQKQMRHINNVFRKTNAPRLYCVGNHDLGRLSKAEVLQNLGIDYSHSVSDWNGVRIITLDTNNLVANEKKYGTNGIVSGAELAWLDEQLNTNLPVVVFSHHSPVQTPEGKIWRTSIIASDETRAVLEKYGNVVAVFSGHRAVNYQTELNGITYVIINNLVDSKALGSYADINVNTDESGNIIEVSVSQYGKKPAAYSFNKTLSTN